MPHVRSAESKKKIGLAKKELNNFKTLQAAIPRLCRRLYKVYSKDKSFEFIGIYSQLKEGAEVKYHIKNAKKQLETGVSDFRPVRILNERFQ